MRKLRFLAAMIIFVGAPELALAQVGTEAPLAAPNAIAGPAQDAKPAKHKAVKHKKAVHHDASHAQNGFPTDRAAASRELALPSSGTAPADPLSFGMTWNGNSDNARETRVQNYNAAAPGSGAEVGMKLHF